MAVNAQHTSCQTVPVALVHDLTVQLQNAYNVEYYSDVFLKSISYKFVQCSENNGFDEPECRDGMFDDYALFSLFDCHYEGKCDGDMQFE